MKIYKLPAGKMVGYWTHLTEQYIHKDVGAGGIYTPIIRETTRVAYYHPDELFPLDIELPIGAPLGTPALAPRRWAYFPRKMFGDTFPIFRIDIELKDLEIIDI